MIYICIPSFDEAPTIGLLLWKIRQTFLEFPREYQLLVANDGSTDQTGEVLEPYQKVLPLTVVTHESRQGYAATIEALLRIAVERTDRPKRDCAVIMHADFTHDPDYLPELVKRIEGGADLVVAQARMEGEPSRALRWVRRLAPWLLRGSARIPGVRDVTSGFAAMRLITLRNAFRGHPGPLLSCGGWAANAELYSRAALTARRVDTIDVIERRDRRERPTRHQPWPTARALWQAGTTLRTSLRRPQAPPEASRPEPAEAAR
ncbi:MAG: glycosyltransferase family 2 protein [Gemmatimonadales bacterium]